MAEGLADWPLKVFSPQIILHFYHSMLFILLRAAFLSELPLTSPLFFLLYFTFNKVVVCFRRF